MSTKSSFTRRRFLAGSLTVSAAALAATVLPDEARAQASHAAHTGKLTKSQQLRGLMFFTKALEFSTLAEAAERIFPADENGPGAKELAVPFFIDNQLAGSYGNHSREYMSGPFFPGAPTQGYQSSVYRKDVILLGLQALNDQAQASYKKNFPSLTDAQKDEILTMCEKDTLKIKEISSAYFFNTLKGMVLAGAYADPIYNGNDNKNGWRMKKYPGHQMAYMGVITNPVFETIEPMSLGDH
jgi:gluconate 2-dehydrogenase gamma chain